MNRVHSSSSIEAIVSCWAEGSSYSDIAKAFGISRNSVSGIIKRNTDAKPGTRARANGRFVSLARTPSADIPQRDTAGHRDATLRKTPAGVSPEASAAFSELPNCNRQPGATASQKQENPELAARG